MNKSVGISVIKEDDQVIIKSNKVLKAFQVRKSRQIRVEKRNFYLDGAIGTTFGSTFEIKSGKLHKVDQAIVEDIVADTESEKDNRNLTDTSDNQKLKKEDIHALRKDGATGKEIIEHLVENSATFREKTEFAQEKYIKKKKKKHEALFTFLKPNTRLLAEMYFSKGPIKICNLRYESIAQILTYGNVRAGSNLIVFESITGLLVGAILERLAGHGALIQLYTGSAASREALDAFQFPTNVTNTLLSFPLKEISSLNTEQCRCAVNKNNSKLQNVGDTESGTKDEELVTQTGEENTGGDLGGIQGTEDSNSNAGQNKSANIQIEISGTNSSNCGKEQSDNIDNNVAMPTDIQVPMETNVEEKIGESSITTEAKKRKADWEAVKEVKKKHRQDEQMKSRMLLESGTMDGLIIASKYHPTPIVMSLIEFVAPSRPVVIFSQYKEPLLDCYVKLRNRGGVLNLRLTENWLRNYQVLSNRTHPEINMSGTGGYLLTGTTVLLDT